LETCFSGKTVQLLIERRDSAPPPGGSIAPEALAFIQSQRRREGTAILRDVERDIARLVHHVGGSTTASAGEGSSLRVAVRFALEDVQMPATPALPNSLSSSSVPDMAVYLKGQVEIGTAPAPVQTEQFEGYVYTTIIRKPFDGIDYFALIQSKGSRPRHSWRAGFWHAWEQLVAARLGLTNTTGRVTDLLRGLDVDLYGKAIADQQMSPGFRIQAIRILAQRFYPAPEDAMWRNPRANNQTQKDQVLAYLATAQSGDQREVREAAISEITNIDRKR
jgi:hypothetical protein